MKQVFYPLLTECAGFTNADRADVARRALAEFAGLSGLRGEELVTVLGDLLSDAMHLAAAADLPPEETLDRAVAAARSHYEAESNPELHYDDPGALRPAEEPLYEDGVMFLDDRDGAEVTRHFIIAGRRPGDDEDSYVHLRLHPGDPRSAWEAFVEDELYPGEELPDGWADGETELAYQSCCYELQSPPRRCG